MPTRGIDIRAECLAGSRESLTFSFSDRQSGDDQHSQQETAKVIQSRVSGQDGGEREISAFQVSCYRQRSAAAAERLGMTLSADAALMFVRYAPRSNSPIAEWTRWMSICRPLTPAPEPSRGLLPTRTGWARGWSNPRSSAAPAGSSPASASR